MTEGVYRLAGREISALETRALEYIKSNIPELEAHLTGTRDFALEINRNQSLELDNEKVALAALCHDLARLMDPAQIEKELRSRGIDPDSFSYVAPILLHGELSAIYAKEKLGIDDVDILRAIRGHATGNGRMSLLDKLIYVADKIEETRTYPAADTLRTLVRSDFPGAFPRVVSAVISWVVAEFLPLDYNSVDAYNRSLDEIKTLDG
jgi:predicted HD superfamily hydrolase involved in NAD metabolism